MGALHARVASAHPDVDLSWVVDPDDEVRQRLAKKHPVNVTVTPKDLRGVDGVIIASPTSSHTTWARAAITEGTPFLVEKPLSVDKAEVEEVASSALASGVPFTVGFVERFNPAVIAARDVMDGDVTLFHGIRHSPFSTRATGGVQWDLMIHDLDLALSFIDSTVDSVAATLASLHPHSVSTSADIGWAGVKFAGRGVATLSASRVSQRKIRTLTIASLERSAEVDLLRQDITVYHHVLEETVDAGPGYRQETIIEIPHISSRLEPLVGQLEHFLELISGNADPLPEAHKVTRPHVVMAAIEEAAGRADQYRVESHMDPDTE